MAIINVAIIKCNSSYESEDDFYKEFLSKGFSFDGNKTLDIILDTAPMHEEITDKNDYFKGYDLSEGLNHYSAQLTFSTVEIAQAAYHSGFVFKVCDGVIMQFMACDAEEYKEYKELEIIEK